MLALQVNNLSKTFAGQSALLDMSLDLVGGEIHALVGENGSGKSTFIKCLSGYHVPDQGAEIRVAGKELLLPFLPNQAMKSGMRFVHQDLGIVPNLSVAENLGLGNGLPTGRWGRINWRKAHEEAHQSLVHVGCNGVSPKQAAGTLPIAIQTMLAIARALDRSRNAGETSVIILDEPSASLPEQEMHLLHRSIRVVAESGVAVLLVSHRLSEIFDLAKRATVLRDGVKIGTYDICNLDHEHLTELIVGRRLAVTRRVVTPPTCEPRQALSVRSLSGGIVKDFDLDIKEGEIVGLAGLRGSGRSSIARMLAGAQKGEVDSFRVRSKEVGTGGIADAIAAGLVYIPEDRKEGSAIASLTVLENLLLPRLHSFHRRLGGLNRRQMTNVSRELISEFGVRPRRLENSMKNLSGGNQQKVILGRWLSLGPAVAVLDEPLRGIDVGAKVEIFELLEDAARRGVGLLVIDSDFENLTKICHRIIVMHEGRTIDELTGTDAGSTETVTRAVFLAATSSRVNT